jgi:hypothetical protein
MSAFCAAYSVSVIRDLFARRAKTKKTAARETNKAATMTVAAPMVSIFLSPISGSPVLQITPDYCDDSCYRRRNNAYNGNIGKTEFPRVRAENDESEQNSDKDTQRNHLSFFLAGPGFVFTAWVCTKPDRSFFRGQPKRDDMSHVFLSDSFFPVFGEEYCIGLFGNKP